MSSKNEPVPRGRRRDTQVDEKIAKAAVSLYGEVGWAGFHFDALARASGVGKAALYLRWPSKEAALLHALETLSFRIDRAVLGGVQEELLHIARQMFALYTGDVGRAWMRLQVERGTLPDILTAWHETFSTEQILSARALVREGVRRGELPAETSSTLLLDTLMGAIQMHVLATPQALRARMLKRSEAYLDKLVRFVLAAARS